jgi:HKD family nuclease
MDVSFIAHGMPQLRTPAGDVILGALQGGLYNSFIGFSAFVSIGGVNNLKDGITSFISNGGSVSLYVGVDLHATSKEALKALIDANIPTKIVYSPNSVVYHPKVYLFRGNTNHMVIVGSSNLTTSGLFQNVESSICVKFNDGDAQGMELENSILRYFDKIIDGTSGSVRDLTEETLQLLVDSNIVLSETSLRKARKTMDDSLPDVPVSANKKVNGKFAKMTVARPPKGHKRTLRSDVITTHTGEHREASITIESLVVNAFSMWIETGRMTGGSRNILDLSKKGRRDGVNKFGSVEFFGVDKDSNNPIPFDVSLIYAGREYEGNSIKYTEGNSNWRIQLKGETAAGEKLTDVLRESGSQDKVFIFERTDTPTKFVFHILGEDSIDQLKDLSTDWAASGNGQGRRYGLLNGSL